MKTIYFSGNSGFVEALGHLEQLTSLTEQGERTPRQQQTGTNTTATTRRIKAATPTVLTIAPDQALTIIQVNE